MLFLNLSPLELTYCVAVLLLNFTLRASLGFGGALGLPLLALVLPVKILAPATASQSGDSGRWKVSGNQLTAQSRSGAVNTYTVEKRNHPKNKRDPMICLNGECYVTFYNKPAW